MEHPDFSLNGRVALLTGAARGIGLGMAKAMAAAGAAVVIQDIDPDVAKSEADAINRAGGKALALGGDACDVEASVGWIDRATEHFGGIHILVNNAAIQLPCPWVEQPIADMERQIRADLLTPIRLCQKALPIFRQQKWGRVINLGSIQQRKGNSHMLAYSLSKSALNTFTHMLARDCAADQVTANLLAPGYFNTYRNREHLRTPEEVAERGKRAVPMGRLGDERDCAGIALLLCSPAGAYITGQTIFVDGGMGQ